MIKELAMKSRFLKRQVMKYRSRTKQPEWESLLKKDREYWLESLNKAKGGKKILLATSVGSHLAGTTLESLLAVALTLRGAEVHVLLCDAVLPACLACCSDLYPNHNKFVKKGPGRDCRDCFEPAYEMYASLGMTIHHYGTYITDDEMRWATDVSETVPFREIGRYTYEGMVVGEHAIAGALRFFARGVLDGEPHAESVLRRYFKSALLAMVATKNLLASHPFETAVFHHGIYVPQGLIGEVCRKKGVHVVNWNPAYRKQCFIFSHGDSYHHTMTTEPVENWLGIRWDEEKEKRLMDYLKSRWQGTQDWIWFHEKPRFDLDEITQQTGIDFTKPIVGLLTSVMWDAVLHYPSNAFPNMLEWVKCTIEYFITRPDLQLVIRIHPAEIRGTLPSRQRMADEIKRLFPDLPKNIIVIHPESDVSTYMVMSQCNSVIIYNTKTGVELTAMGIPVIVAGEAWIRNKGFAMDVDGMETYFKILDLLPLQHGMNENDISKAKKYAFHFFFRRMIPLEFMNATNSIPPYAVNIDSLQDLFPGRSRGLDLICDGILKETKFIYFLEDELIVR